MLLALNIGNSRTSFGLFDGARLLHHWRAETKRSRSADEYAAFIFPLFTQVGVEPKALEGAVVCSVVPPAAQNFEMFCASYLGIAPLMVHNEIRLGFQLDVDIPGQVGADRIANAAFAVNRMNLPAVVVDLGTATTFDVISHDRKYKGGAILPGVQMGAQVLARETSLLPLVDLRFPKNIIGRNTVECIQGGLMYGYCDLIQGMVGRINEELGEQCEVALTGGLGNIFHERLKVKTNYLPNLTLEGVEILFRLNSLELKTNKSLLR